MSDKKPYSEKVISGSDLHGVWLFVKAQRDIIMKSLESTEDDTGGPLESIRKSCLVLTANALGDTMDEIADLLDKN